MKWHKIEDGDPGIKGTDKFYLVALDDEFITISYFFVDSYGHWWSSNGNIWDKTYSYNKKETAVTHWAKIPKLPD